jgi:hypothetical protein
MTRKPLIFRLLRDGAGANISANRLSATVVLSPRQLCLSPLFVLVRLTVIHYTTLQYYVLSLLFVLVCVAVIHYITVKSYRITSQNMLSPVVP